MVASISARGGGLRRACLENHGSGRSTHYRLVIACRWVQPQHVLAHGHDVPVRKDVLQSPALWPRQGTAIGSIVEVSFAQCNSMGISNVGWEKLQP